MLIDQYLDTLERASVGGAKKSIFSGGDWWQSFSAWALASGLVTVCHERGGLLIWRDAMGLYYGDWHRVTVTMVTPRELAAVFGSVPDDGAGWLETARGIMVACCVTMTVEADGARSDLSLAEAVAALQSLALRKAGQCDKWREWYIRRIESKAMKPIVWNEESE